MFYLRWFKKAYFASFEYIRPIPELQEIYDLEQRILSEKKLLLTSFSKVLTDVKQFSSKNGEDNLAKTMFFARLGRISTEHHTTETLFSGETIKDSQNSKPNLRAQKKTNRKSENHQDLLSDFSNHWRQLGLQPGGHQIYRAIRDHYKTTHGLRTEALEEHLTYVLGDDALSKRILSIRDPAALGDFFPLGRKGEWILYVFGKNSNKENSREESCYAGSISHIHNIIRALSRIYGLKKGTVEYNRTFSYWPSKDVRYGFSVLEAKLAKNDKIYKAQAKLLLRTRKKKFVWSYFPLLDELAALSFTRMPAVSVLNQKNISRDMAGFHKRVFLDLSASINRDVADILRLKYEKVMEEKIENARQMCFQTQSENLLFVLQGKPKLSTLFNYILISNLKLSVKAVFYKKSANYFLW